MKNRLIIIGADFSANAILGKVETSYSLNVDITSVDVPRHSPVTIYAHSEMQTYNDDVLMGSAPAPISVSATSGVVATVGDPDGSLYPIVIDGSAATAENCTVTIAQIGSSNVATVEAICQIYAIKRTTNAPLMDVVYAQGWSASPDYMTFGEAAAVTTFNDKFKGNTAMQSFEEARYFTGLTSLGTSQFQGNTALTKVSFRDARLSGSAFEMIRTFRDCSQLSEIDMTNMFVDGQEVSMYDTFRGTAITNFKFPKMTYKHYVYGGENCQLFYNCANLESLDMSDLTMDFTLGKPASPNNYTWGLTACCYGCSSLTKFTWPTEKIIGAVCSHNMFAKCTSLENIDTPNIDVSTLVLIGAYNLGMFDGCSKLKTFDVSWLEGAPLVSAQMVFRNCTELTEVTGLDKIQGSPEGIDLACFFYGANIREADFGNIIKATSIERLVSYCPSIERVVLPRALSGIGGYPFHNSPKLTTVESRVPVDVSAVTNFGTFLGYAASIIHLPQFTGINAALNASACTKLTRQSVLNLIYGLADRTGQDALTLQLSSASKNLLTDDEKAYVASINWTLA